MVEEYETALAFFAKAKALYQRIGDQASYAYTLWGEGTAYKMLGWHEKALEDFKQAEAIFTKTYDSRGKVYTCLGKGELLLLTGKLPQAEQKFQQASQTAQRFRFRFEQVHALLLLKLLKEQRGRKVSFQDVFQRYSRYGSCFLKEPAAPVNLP